MITGVVIGSRYLTVNVATTELFKLPFSVAVTVMVASPVFVPGFIFIPSMAITSLSEEVKTIFVFSALKSVGASDTSTVRSAALSKFLTISTSSAVLFVIVTDERTGVFSDTVTVTSSDKPPAVTVITAVPSATACSLSLFTTLTAASLSDLTVTTVLSASDSGKILTCTVRLESPTCHNATSSSLLVIVTDVTFDSSSGGLFGLLSPLQAVNAKALASNIKTTNTASANDLDKILIFPFIFFAYAIQP